MNYIIPEREKQCRGCDAFTKVNGIFACLEVFVRMNKTIAKTSVYIYSMYRDKFCPCKTCLVKCQCDHTDGDEIIFECPLLLESFVKYEQYLLNKYGPKSVYSFDKYYTEIYDDYKRSLEIAKKRGEQ
jgi:hypothetical protein